jgi:hypothetical protein
VVSDKGCEFSSVLSGEVVGTVDMLHVASITPSTESVSHDVIHAQPCEPGRAIGLKDIDWSWNACLTSGILKEPLQLEGRDLLLGQLCAWGSYACATASGPSTSAGIAVIATRGIISSSAAPRSAPAGVVSVSIG